ncbi:MAG: glycosyltransferase [Planctomycetota bacterium]
MSATRLAMVVPDLRVGGLQAMAVRLAQALDRSEWEPRLYTFDGGGPLLAELERAGLEHVDLPRGAGRDSGYAGRLAERLLADGVGLVHCHNLTALWHGGRAARQARRLPVLYTEHDRDFPGSWRQRLLHRWLARRATRTVAVSECLVGQLVRWEGFSRSTSCLHNGVDDPQARFGGSRSAARRELGWDEAPWLLAVGSLTEVKNHVGLLQVFERVLAELPDARLAVAGEGRLREFLRASSGQLPTGSVQWLGERDDVPRLLAACDLFVLPSRSEGLSLSLIEAHGAARVSLAFDVGGNREVLEDGRTGRLFAFGDEAGLAGAAVELLRQGAGRESWEQAARARYLAAFTHERMVARYVELYRGLRDRRRG